MEQKNTINRRKFIKNSSIFTLGAGILTLPHTKFTDSPTSSIEELNIMGPKEGFTPQIGTLVSMLNWMRYVIISPVKGMSVDDLDYLLDQKSNSIGAMLWHLAATERYYQIHTFENKKWGDWSQEDKDMWSIASSLGDKGREVIKGHDLDFYLTKLKKVREHTSNELAKRDDEWLMKVDHDWYWGPTNNYCKWFHVCEHESNHNGQIKFIKSRLPSSKKTNS